MRYYRKIGLFLLLAFLLGLATEAQAQTGSCQPALGEAFLDINNVRARILNNGNLFWRGSPHVYEVPKGGHSNAIFASGIWLGGTVGGQLRVAASRYGPYEFWAGPLDESGNPPTSCSDFDHVFKVNRADIEEYEATGVTTPDLRNWPTGLGAPTTDADGNMIEILDQPLSQRINRTIDLAAGERPAILGDQSLWWVMNDRGNTHDATDAPPLGVEVHVMAFAFNTSGAIGNTTFYKYNIFYKGDVPLDNTYIGLFSDPDLGNFQDDYVGSNPELGVGYVYNADDDDEGGEGYGPAPPAAGYDFFQGPIVPSPGDSAMVDGNFVHDFANLDMTSFVFYNNGGGVTEDPRTAADYYNYMQANWKDGKHITFGGNGRDFSEDPTNFMYPGNPAAGEFWSEVNSDGNGTAIEPADRRFVMSSGPFTINPGDFQQVVFGIVWARGADHLDSVTEMFKADQLAQAAFDVNFELPSPPAAPNVTATAMDGRVLLEWENSTRSNNFLEAYRAEDPFAPDESKEYVFEGYNVFQYENQQDQIGKLIAVYDVDNGITRVIDGIPGEPTEITANGSDRGVQRFHDIGALTNYQTYYFGVQAYAYNPASAPKVYLGPISRVEVIPTRTIDVLSEAAVEAASDLNDADINAASQGVGEGLVWIDIVNPARVQDANYSVEFYETEIAEAPAARVTDTEAFDAELIGRMAPSAGKSAATTAITYDLKRDGTVLFSGAGMAAPQRENVLNVDGQQVSVTGPVPDFTAFQVIANAAGPVDPPNMGAFAFNSSGFPLVGGNDRPTRGVQQSTNNSAWGIHTGGGSRSKYNNDGGQSFIERSIRNGFGPIGSNNFEWRFSQRCALPNNGACQAWRGFTDGQIFDVPFELWNTGPTADPSDDYRMIPVACESGCGAGIDDLVFDIGNDHAISGGANDPYSDWIYWYNPEDNGATPGEQGYNDFFFGPAGVGDEVMARMVLVSWNGGSAPPYDVLLPETGTVFQIVTTKPNAPGDVFTWSTAGLGAQAPDNATLQARLDQIGIVPNPYKGASSYEVSQLVDEVRFTNLPDFATIRVFTLNGTLIRTLEKQSPGVATLSWDLTTDSSLPLASGMYLIHVDVPGIGEKVLKFAVVKKRIQLNTF
ncbi:MAG: hypothetical protein ACE5G0_11575 [Rhodothermales bacterium]